MTFDDIKLRVAVRAQLIEQDSTTGKRIALTTQPAADMLTRAVNDAIEEFQAGVDPRSGESYDWSFLTAAVEITLNEDGDSPLNIDGDPARYVLFDYLASLPQGIAKWGLTDARGGDVYIRHMDEVAGMHMAAPNQSGAPRFIAAEWKRSLGAKGDQRGGYELRVFPDPDQAYTLRFRSRVAIPPFTDGGQRGHWPAAHDMTVAALAVRALFLEDREADNPDVIRANAEADRRMVMSIEHDKRHNQPDDVAGPGAVSLDGYPTFRIYDETTSSYLTTLD